MGKTRLSRPLWAEYVQASHDAAAPREEGPFASAQTLLQGRLGRGDALWESLD